MKKIQLLLCFWILLWFHVNGQNSVAELVSAMLGETPIEEDLQELCDVVGGRVTGSVANQSAVEWAKDKFAKAGVSYQVQSFEMPAKWIPGETAMSIYQNDQLQFEVSAVSKYMTPAATFHKNIVYINDIKNASKANQNALKGHFLLVDADLCFDIPGLFAEYSHAKHVEDFAREHGAAGIIFMSSRPNKLLYTFISSQGADNTLPQFIMAREDAKRCIRIIENGRNLNTMVKVNADIGEKFESHNVIAEIKGGKYPDEIIIIGAHLDSWNLGTGANDNGCNVSMMIDIARQMKKLNIIPDRTIRFALWNGEEQGYFGSHAYTVDHQEELDNHKMALSIDIGSGAITGFFTNGREELINEIDAVLRPVSGLGEFTQINAPIVGTDNFDFMLQGVPNLVANHLSTNYGTNYHASSDTYDKVDLKSLKRNSAVVAALTLGLANSDLDDWDRQSRTEIQKIFDDTNLEFTMRMFNVWEPWISGQRGRKE